jgi:hypothetical protein
MDKFELGIEITKVLGGGIKLAILAPSQIIDRLGKMWPSIAAGGLLSPTVRKPR